MSGQQFNLPVSTYYPIFNLSDSMTWQKSRHTIQYGVSWYREQDHYWNPPAGFSNYSLGLATGDPALNAFTSDPNNTTHRDKQASIRWMNYRPRSASLSKTPGRPRRLLP